ncbi:MAG: ACT domain-containing protein [Ginsengibacter sp.]
MNGENDLNILLKTMKPRLNIGDYVFCVVDDLTSINTDDTILIFKEQEGNTIIINKELADILNLDYSFICSWITLTVHSSLEAVGLTAAISTSLSESGISCNVVAAFYHDHLFVNKKDAERAMQILDKFSEL